MQFCGLFLKIKSLNLLIWTQEVRALILRRETLYCVTIGGVAKNKRRSEFGECKERRIEKITLGRPGFLFDLIDMQCFATVSMLASKAE